MATDVLISSKINDLHDPNVSEKKLFMASTKLVKSRDWRLFLNWSEAMKGDGVLLKKKIF